MPNADQQPRLLDPNLVAELDRASDNQAELVDVIIRNPNSILLIVNLLLANARYSDASLLISGIKILDQESLFFHNIADFFRHITSTGEISSHQAQATILQIFKFIFDRQVPDDVFRQIKQEKDAFDRERQRRGT